MLKTLKEKTIKTVFYAFVLATLGEFSFCHVLTIMRFKNIYPEALMTFVATVFCLYNFIKWLIFLRKT